MKIALPLATFVLTSLVTPVFAAGLADQISVVDPYVRMAPPGAKVTGRLHGRQKHQRQGYSDRQGG